MREKISGGGRVFRLESSIHCHPCTSADGLSNQCSGDSPLDCFPAPFIYLGNWLNRTDVKTAVSG